MVKGYKGHQKCSKIRDLYPLRPFFKSPNRMASTALATVSMATVLASVCHIELIFAASGEMTKPDKKIVFNKKSTKKNLDQFLSNEILKTNLKTITSRQIMMSIVNIHGQIFHWRKSKITILP